jgi:hypothetical protein
MTADTTTAVRPVMTRDELAAHRVAAHGRDYSRSDDGYGDVEVAESEGWKVIAGWGADGWDLGSWPYVAISVRDRAETPELRLRGAKYELQQVVEGDHDLYRFDSEEDRTAAIDYLFLWYAAGEDWAPLTYEDRARLDVGKLDVDPKFRGPYRRDRAGL